MTGIHDKVGRTIRYRPSQTNRPTLPSSPSAMSHTTSPIRSRGKMPALRSSVSHSTTLASDNQSPSGDGTNTRSKGARRKRNNGDLNPPDVWVLPRGRCTCELAPWDQAEFVGDGARLDCCDTERCFPP